jgi:hypothetical protein
VLIVCASCWSACGALDTVSMGLAPSFHGRDQGPGSVLLHRSGPSCRHLRENIVHVVAWTLADLAGRDRPDADLVETALFFRDRRAA